MVLYYILSFHY